MGVTVLRCRDLRDLAPIVVACIDAMIARIAHDPGGRVETHRSRIEERGAATSMFLAMHDT